MIIVAKMFNYSYYSLLFKILNYVCYVRSGDTDRRTLRTSIVNVKYQELAQVWTIVHCR